MNISYTTRHHLCLGCGLCEDICPQGAITIDIRQGEYRPSVDESLCIGSKCGRCSDICPGLGVDLLKLSTRQDSLTNGHVTCNEFLGRYVQLYTGHCTNEDIRYHSASGGLVTGLLVYLLEKKMIDGAVVTRLSSSNHLTPEAFIARNTEELISARSSKYCPVSMQGIRKQIREAEGKYVIVGLPCHLHGFRKIEEKDEKFREHVFAYWGLYCSSGRTFHLTDYILQQRHINKDDIRYFSYRDEGCLGSLVVKCSNEVYKERYQSYFHPLRSIFIPRRCHFCIDHSAELADISFGDIHIKPYSDDTIGINSLIVRTPQMNELLQQAMRDGAIVMEELNEATLVASQKMARVKKTKYASLVYWCKRMGMTVPQYDVKPYSKIGFVKSLLYLMNLNLQYQVGHHRHLWFVIKYMLKKRKS